MMQPAYHYLFYLLLTPTSATTTSIIDLSQPLSRTSHSSSGDLHLQSLAQNEPRLRSSLVLQNGGIVSEYNRDDIDPSNNVEVWSATKSWTGMLIGLLVQEDLLGLDETLGDIFPQEVWSNITDAQFRQNVTISELLSMSSGFDDEWTRGYQWTTYDNGTGGGANLTDSLQFPLIGEKNSFRYLGTSQILSYVLSARTDGMTPFQYLKDKVLPYLAINDNDIDWWTNVDQMSYGYHGLNLTPEQMAKFGQLYLQRGMASPTTQLINSDWVDASSTPKINVRERPFFGFSIDYGYLMWIFTFPDGMDIASSFCAMGIGGQYTCICPELQRVSVQTQDWNLDLQRNDTLTEILDSIAAFPIVFSAMNKTLDFGDGEEEKASIANPSESGSSARGCMTITCHAVLLCLGYVLAVFWRV